MRCKPTTESSLPVVSDPHAHDKSKSLSRHLIDKPSAARVVASIEVHPCTTWPFRRKPLQGTHDLHARNVAVGMFAKLEDLNLQAGKVHADCVPVLTPAMQSAWFHLLSLVGRVCALC